MSRKRLSLFKAKRTDNGEWIEGCPVIDYVTGQYFIHAKGNSVNESDKVNEEGCLKFLAFEIDPETVCMCTGKEYMNCEIAYEGDIFESQVSGDLMILRFGTYEAYCPADKVVMDCVGFYAECEGYPDMPIGDLHDYALKKGNIFDNPDLVKKEDMGRK